MNTIVFVAMLGSALLHASWNGWVKSRRDPYGALIALGIGAAWPNLALLAWNGLPVHAAWLWIGLTILLSVPAQALLGRAYREGDFAVAYPVVRGLNPVAIAIASVFVYGERLALPNALGVVCISAGVALLGWEALRRSRTVTLHGLSFAALSALATSTGALTDSIGARTANDPLSYGPLIAIGNAIAMAAYQVRRVNLARTLVEHAPLALLGPLLSTASYQLLVWSVSRAPVALVVSLRETSLLFAVAIGALLLGERVGPWRWLAVAIVFVGVLGIRFTPGGTPGVR
jgi:drug/metabolite transporter (DMT)-like permease